MRAEPEHERPVASGSQLEAVKPGAGSTPTQTACGETTALGALRQAQDKLMVGLARREEWRALQQLNVRENAGEWLDVIEMDVLREKLTQQLAADPEFLAWQFVDAAIGCLAAGARVAPQVDRGGGSDILPLSVAPDIPALAMQPPVEVSAHLDGSGDGAPAMRSLSLRIPTLISHAPSLQVVEEVVAAKPFAHMPPAVLREPKETLAVKLPDQDSTVEATQFDPRAVGIGEAEVTIVRRKAEVVPLLDPRLPPTPLQDRSQLSSPATARPSRAPIAKWTDPIGDAADDFRPVGSATDEAQVTIIPTGADKISSARAGRRALGVAPDRESQVRKFLKTLGGE